MWLIILSAGIGAAICSLGSLLALGVIAFVELRHAKYEK